MAVTATFQYHDGAAWQDITRYSQFLTFSGSPRNIALPLGYRRWQRGSHLGSAWPGVDLCGVGHLPNVRYVSATSCDIGAGVIALTDAAVGSGENVTFRIKVSSPDGAMSVNGARLFVFDVFDPSRPVPGVEVQAWEYGVGATSWTQINDGINLGTPNSYLSLGDQAEAADHYYYIAISVRAITKNVLPSLSFGFAFDSCSIDAEVAASADDAFERTDTNAVNTTSAGLYLNYYGTISSPTWVGARWMGLTIPKGANITDARLRLRARNAASTSVSVTIHGESSPSPASFSSAIITTRARTTESVAWSVENWTGGVWYNSPDLSDIISELTGSDTSWVPGTSGIALLIEPGGGTNNRIASAYDDTGYAPHLLVEFTPAVTSYTWRGRVVNSSGEPEYEVWILDGDHKRLEIIDDILELDWEIGRQGMRSFSAKLPVSSRVASLLQTYDLIKIRRGGCDLLDGRNENPQYTLSQEGEDVATLSLEGRGLEHVLDERIIIPDAGKDFMTFGPGRPDDLAKEFVRYNMVAGYVTDSNRAFSGMTVAPNRSEVPLPAETSERTWKGDHTNNLFDFLQDKASAYEFDFAVRADGKGNLRFETFYPRLGLDRTNDNAEGNDEVVLAVTRDNVLSLQTHNAKFNVRNSIYVGGRGTGAWRTFSIAKDTESIAAYRLREMFVDMGGLSDTNVLAQQGRTALAINGDPIKGITLQVQPTDDVKIHRDIWVGDRCSISYSAFGISLDDPWEVERIRGKLNQDGTESIEITLGKIVPSLLDVMDAQRKSGAAAARGEPPPLNTPTTIFAGDESDIASGPNFAYDDHKHGVTTAAPSGGIGSSNLEGSANSLARSDHQHKCPNWNHIHDRSLTIADDGEHDHTYGGSSVYTSWSLVATKTVDSGIQIASGSDHYHQVAGIPANQHYHYTVGSSSSSATAYTSEEPDHDHAGSNVTIGAVMEYPT